MFLMVQYTVAPWLIQDSCVSMSKDVTTAAEINRLYVTNALFINKIEIII